MRNRELWRISGKVDGKNLPTHFDQWVHTDVCLCFVCPQSESGDNTVYSLQFTTRRTNCLSSDKKHWTDCDYLPEKKVTVQQVTHGGRSLIDHITVNDAPLISPVALT